MAKLDNLRILKLIDLVLERFEANHLLDEVLDSCCTQLRVLYLVNTTTVHCPIMHVGLFINLQVQPNYFRVLSYINSHLLTSSRYWS